MGKSFILGHVNTNEELGPIAGGAIGSETSPVTFNSASVTLSFDAAIAASALPLEGVHLTHMSQSTSVATASALAPGPAVANANFRATER